MKWIMTHRRMVAAAVFFVLDIVTICLSYYGAMYLTHGCDAIPAWHLQFFLQTIPFYILVCLAIYWSLRMYTNVWQFISYHEFILYSFAVFVCVLIYFCCGSILRTDIPRRYYLFGGWIQLWCTLFLRFSYRFRCFLLSEIHARFPGKKAHRRNSMLIGAGAAGLLIVRDILDHANSEVSIRCIIDDDPSKIGCRLCGIPVVGGRNEILACVDEFDIDEILFAIPSASALCKREILNICNESNCKIRMLPGVEQLVTGQVTLARMRNVTIEELLERDPIIVKNDVISRQLSGRVVMVTGGGGSIGSELCRQIAGHNPKRLIIFDVYENNAYDIQQELKHAFPALDLQVLIGSVRDTQRVLSVFRRYRPDFVFHAAAHKHVPLMESSPCEAVKNNVLGTCKTAYAAMRYGCRRFVLISTDKAVNPSNIMGATKRLCEKIVQSLNKISHGGDLSLLPEFLTDAMPEEDAAIPYPTEFVAVRFGNVLGSNGSVIPLFKKQIEAGGPVTVTHPDIIRYFMTIPEAVSLVLDAATDAKGGEIFVLDMGAPVKIDSLARNLIKLSGFVPDVDIKIEYCGLRSGEKLFEEKLMSEEGLTMTQNQLIHVAKPLDWDLAQFFRDLEELARQAYRDDAGIVGTVKKMVPTFHPKD